jgi:hypothetical protein
MPEVAREPGAFAATPVFIIPDEIVPGAVNVKDFPNLIKAARKKNARGSDGQAAWFGLAVELGMTVRQRHCRQVSKTIIQGRQGEVLCSVSFMLLSARSPLRSTT